MVCGDAPQQACEARVSVFRFPNPDCYAGFLWWSSPFVVSRQAEDHISAGFRSKTLKVTPVVVVGQNYSSESLAFFVRLFHEIGSIGQLNIRITSSGNLYVSWRTDSWK